MGASNASVSLLPGMIILKEAMNWSDLQLFEQCRFNILVRGTLGLYNLTDEIPAKLTYTFFASAYMNITGKREKIFLELFSIRSPVARYMILTSIEIVSG
jgi:hypothetical protein